MGLLSNKIDRESLKPGDHIYTWRTAYIYAHHGIYVGDDNVIHFTTRGQEVGSGTVLPVSSSLTVPLVPCLTCLPLKEDHGLLLSCLTCFLAGGNLYRFEYNVTRTFLLTKIRGGTCSLAKSDSLEIVVYRAQFLLDNNGFGCYNTIQNNCEDFAIYCKTGLVVADPVSTGKSGQAFAFAGVSVTAISSAALRLLTANPYALTAMAVGTHYSNRVACDVGMRTDVVKLEVEDLTKRIQLSMQSESKSGDRVHEEHRFVQAVEGINKKGTVYGYVKKSTTSYPEKSSGDDSSSISEMEARLQKSEDELQATRKMLKNTQEVQKLQGELIASLISRLNGSS